MPRAARPQRAWVDYQPLRDAIADSGRDFKAIAVEAGIPFKKVIDLMLDPAPEVGSLLSGTELVRLADWLQVPLSELYCEAR